MATKDSTVFNLLLLLLLSGCRFCCFCCRRNKTLFGFHPSSSCIRHVNFPKSESKMRIVCNSIHEKLLPKQHETRVIHASDVRFSWVDGDALNNTKTAWKHQNKKPNMLKCESYERFCCIKFKCSAKKPLIHSGVLVSTLIVQHSLIPLKSREQETNNA